MNIAVIAVIPTPYRDPFWHALSNHPDVNLDVFYCAGSKADRPWDANWAMDYPYQILPGHNLLKTWKADASLYLNPSIIRRLKEKKYQAILIAGYNHPTMVQVLAYARRTSIPCYMICETWRKNRGQGLKATLQAKLVKWSFDRVRGGLPTGRLASDYLQDRGIQLSDQFRIPNVPDISAIQRHVSNAQPQRKALREQWHLGDKHVTLFVGRWITKKRIVPLIEAFAQLPEASNRRLVLVGDGPEKENVTHCIKKHQLEDVVITPGFLQPRETLDWYATADLFVLPSAETWGVAPIEAAAAGLPVIISDQAGCHPDLVEYWPATQVYSLDDMERLAELLKNPPERPGISETAFADWLQPALAKKLMTFLNQHSATT